MYVPAPAHPPLPSPTTAVLSAFNDESVLTRDSLASQAYARLRRGLMNGHFLPGQKMILRTLTDELGISPTPIREALARLVSEQALVQLDRRSVRVPGIDLARWREVRDLRLELEAIGAARAAETATDSEIDQLEAAHAQLQAAKVAGDFPRTLDCNERFHMGLNALARMPVLFRILEGLWLQCGPMMNAFQYSPPLLAERHNHLVVLRGLRTRDGALAAQGIRADILSLEESMVEQLIGRTAS